MVESEQNTERQTLLDRTRDLLANRPRALTLDKIEEDTGLSTSWLSAISKNRIENPSCNSVQKLYEYLTKTQLSY